MGLHEIGIHTRHASRGDAMIGRYALQLRNKLAGHIFTDTVPSQSQARLFKVSTNHCAPVPKRAVLFLHRVWAVRAVLLESLVGNVAEPRSGGASRCLFLLQYLLLNSAGAREEKGGRSRLHATLWISETFVWEDARVWGDEDAGMIVPERIP